MKHKERIFGLDLLRAVAILIVVYGHSGIVAPQLVGNFYSFRLPGGVDMFFVLSGFLIGQILIKLLKENTLSTFADLRKFWYRRWMRTLPLYYFILLVNYLLAKYNFIASDLEHFSWSFIIFSQNLTIGFIGFFQESWSLSIEEWFYLITPILLLISIRILKTKLSILIVILLMISVPIFYRYLMFDPNIDGFWFNANVKKVVLTRLDAIGYGVLAAYTYIYHKDLWQNKRYLFSLLGVGLIGFYLYIHPSHTSIFGGVWYLSILPIGVMFLLPFFNNLKRCSIHLIRTIITFISKISYSMYLVNLSIVALILEKNFPEIDSFSGIRNFVLFWIFTILISTITYFLVEKTFLNIRDRN